MKGDLSPVDNSDTTQLVNVLKIYIDHKVLGSGCDLFMHSIPGHAVYSVQFCINHDMIMVVNGLKPANQKLSNLENSILKRIYSYMYVKYRQCW